MARRKKTSKSTEINDIKSTDVNVHENIENVKKEVKESNKKQTKAMQMLKRINDTIKKFDEDYFKNSTCNYKFFGEWQKRYAIMIENVFGIKNVKIADIGGAYGAIAEAMALRGNDVTNIEISKHVMKNKIFKHIKYVNLPVQYMNGIEDETFDFIHISHVLKHLYVDDIKMAFKEISRILKKDGIVFIITDFTNNDNEKLWLNIAKKYNLTLINKDLKEKIEKLHDSINYFKKYNWDYLIFKK